MIHTRNNSAQKQITDEWINKTITTNLHKKKSPRKKKLLLFFCKLSSRAVCAKLFLFLCCPGFLSFFLPKCVCVCVYVRALAPINWYLTVLLLLWSLYTLWRVKFNSSNEQWIVNAAASNNKLFFFAHSTHCYSKLGLHMFCLTTNTHHATVNVHNTNWIDDGNGNVK